jgi:G3E family GTPase
MLEGNLQGDWKPGEARQSKIVFIGRNLDEESIRRGFLACAA